MKEPGPRFAACAPVLVIESAPELGAMWVRALGELGQMVLLVRNADEALALLTEIVPAVVVVDFRMPAGQALRLRGALQARQPPLPAVIVALGSFDRRALAGAVVLANPTDVGALTEVVCAHLKFSEPELAPLPLDFQPPTTRTANVLQRHVLRALHDGPLAPTSVGERLLGDVPRRRVRPALRELLALGWVERMGRLRWKLTDAGRRELERFAVG